jgi:hypothetical protein
MPKFGVMATVGFHYIVEAATEEEAEDLLIEKLGFGEDWTVSCGLPDVIDDPRVKAGAVGCDNDVACLGPAVE